MKLGRPAGDEYPPFADGYVAAVEGDDPVRVLSQQAEAMTQLFESLDDEKALSRCEEGKWSIKEVLCHISDTERIFSARCCESREVTLRHYLALIRTNTCRFPARTRGHLRVFWTSFFPCGLPRCRC